MAKYTKQEWVDNETLINAAHMNHIEDGIESASEDADSAITGIKVNGESATVNNHVAEIEVVADVPIEHIEVNGTEQPIEDKTVNIDVPSKTSQLENDSGYITQPTYDADEEAVVF